MSAEQPRRPLLQHLAHACLFSCVALLGLQTIGFGAMSMVPPARITAHIGFWWLCGGVALNLSVSVLLFLVGVALLTLQTYRPQRESWWRS
jgi:hypothetical protein